MKNGLKAGLFKKKKVMGLILCHCCRFNHDGWLKSMRTQVQWRKLNEKYPWVNLLFLSDVVLYDMCNLMM